MSTTALASRLDQVLLRLPRQFPGPGGAVAVLREGEVLARHSWGWANAEKRIAFTPQTLFRMCSITKQFTCALLLDQFPDPNALDGDLRRFLPHLDAARPGVLHLCHNQSGLRDYWAVAMLLGAPAESPFGDHEAHRLIASARSLQFAPGSRYSYVNQNFRLISDLLQDRTGRSFAELLRARIFDRGGMEAALLAAETSAMPDGTEGYEGTQASGFRPAVNRILWTGDAGLGACLDDMIAWERHIDATRDDPGALYNRLAAPVSFADGAPASYGFGLGRRTEFGRALTGHGGALRGWRSHRLHVAADRISVVVLFNHLGDAQGAALALLGAALGEETSSTASGPGAAVPAPDWLGAYVEPETGLSARIDQVAGDEVRLRFGHAAERLALQPDGSAGDGAVRLRPAPDGLWMDRATENQSSLLRPLAPAGTVLDASGRYRCAELEAELTLVDAGGVLYGAFSGPLGAGRMELLDPVGADVWALPCPRALDHTPPGDWTLTLQRGKASGGVREVLVGCWLARGLRYEKV